MLGHRLRRCPSIEPTLGERFVFAGIAPPPSPRANHRLSTRKHCYVLLSTRDTNQYG